MDTAHDARRQDGHRRGSIENAVDESYNHAVSTARISGHFLQALLVAPLLVGGVACEKKQTTETGPGPSPDRPSEPADTTPLPGVDTSKLDAAKQKLFYTLLGSLNSPCGKAESLRKSVTSDKSCKRAPYAVRLVLALVEDEGPEPLIRDLYRLTYEGKPQTFDLSKAPRLGNDDAKVQLVEFYDYGCPHCKEFKPILEQLLEQHRDKLAAYFLMYPLGHWKDSPSAAQASLAAAQQGKFKEMHALLFERTPQHGREAVMSYAKELGLDLDKFTAAYEAAAAQVDADHEQGKKADVQGTPAIFINGRRFPTGREYADGRRDPALPFSYLGMWIEEEAAVNR
jgi:thiol-disulfide isomerase/thioredoxin